MNTKWVSVKFITLEVYFSEFTATVSYNHNIGIMVVLSAYSTDPSSKRISVTTEMFEQIEEAVKSIIQNINEIH